MPNANAADWTARKEMAVRYPPPSVERGWKFIDEFTDAAKSYTEFQDAIYALYPGVTKTREFTTTDVRRAIAEQLVQKPVADINDYSRFYVKVCPMLGSLLTKSRITHLEANQFIAEVLDPNLANLIANRLTFAFSNRTADTPYTIEQFHEATIYVLQH